MEDLGLNLTPGINASLDKTFVFLVPILPSFLKERKKANKQQNTNTPPPILTFQNVLERKCFHCDIPLKTSITDFQLTGSLKIFVTFTMLCHRTSRLWATNLLLWSWKKSVLYTMSKKVTNIYSTTRRGPPHKESWSPVRSVLCSFTLTWKASQNNHCYLQMTTSWRRTSN